MNATLGKFVNNVWYGVLIVIFWGTIGWGVSLVIGVGLSNNAFLDLYTGIITINGAVILWSLLSLFVLAGITIGVAKNRNAFKVLDRSHKDTVPEHRITFGHLLFLGILIAVSLTVVGVVTGVIGQSLSSTDIRGLYQAGLEGNFGTLIVGIILLAVVGTISMHLATSPKVAKAEEALGLGKI